MSLGGGLGLPWYELHLTRSHLCRVEWRSPHFGHPGKTRFHAGLIPSCRFVMATTPNPKFVDGVWVSREGGIEGSLYVPSNRRKRFERLFERYAKGFGMTGPVEYLPSWGWRGIHSPSQVSSDALSPPPTTGRSFFYQFLARGLKFLADLKPF